MGPGVRLGEDWAHSSRRLGLWGRVVGRRFLTEPSFSSFRTGSGKTVSNVITESHNSDNEDDDQFVVEAAPQLPEMSELEVVGEAPHAGPSPPALRSVCTEFSSEVSVSFPPSLTQSLP